MSFSQPLQPGTSSIVISTDVLYLTFGALRRFSALVPFPRLISLRIYLDIIDSNRCYIHCIVNASVLRLFAQCTFCLHVLSSRLSLVCICSVQRELHAGVLAVKGPGVPHIAHHPSGLTPRLPDRCHPVNTSSTHAYSRLPHVTDSVGTTTV